ncbi:MAG: hypoxanthine-guanine phosphoribosyltransferase [Rickettsiella sp.]|nr:hypoxanthine-guanine phosphoribosyltransferase [Rickettsiella sp.]
MLIPTHIQEVKQKAKCLFTKKEIEAGLDKIAKAISETLSEKNPVVLCVLIGGLIPAGNLLPRLDFPLELDYIHATRYEQETIGADIKWVVKPRVSLKNRNVLIIEDILDGGLTLAAIVEYCHQQGASAVHTAVLLDKQGAERAPGGTNVADFTAIAMNDGFVFGYGMDYDGYLRNAPGIYVVSPEHE